MERRSRNEVDEFFKRLESLWPHAPHNPTTREDLQIVLVYTRRLLMLDFL